MKNSIADTVATTSYREEKDRLFYYFSTGHEVSGGNPSMWHRGFGPQEELNYIKIHATVFYLQQNVVLLKQILFCLHSVWAPCMSGSLFFFRPIVDYWALTVLPCWMGNDRIGLSVGEKNPCMLLKAQSQRIPLLPTTLCGLLHPEDAGSYFSDTALCFLSRRNCSC